MRALPDGRWAGVLRGASALVLLDADLAEIARISAPPSSAALSVDGASAFVAGELSNEVVAFEAAGSRWIEQKRLRVFGVHGVRALAHDAERLYAVDEHGGRLVTIDRQKPELQRSVDAGSRPFEVARVGSVVLVASLLDHSVSIFELDSEGWPRARSARIQHDGPIWAFDAAPDAAGLTLALGGVEDHPLDRTIGSFGHIDSFLFVYRWQPGQRPQRLTEVNVSELGVLTPKAVRIARREPLTVDVWGYGGDRRSRLQWSELARAPRASTVSLAPGTAGVASAGDRVATANPLLDAWTIDDGTTVRSVAVAGAPPRDSSSRLGEALFYTHLMAPANVSDGALSRFTCETCHFEGSVDGRVHHTGRGNVRATTKPLLGLFGNRPYFSRALDPDLAKLVDNEFRVAGAGSRSDPWFDLGAAEHPWLAALGVSGRQDALELRRALMLHLIEARHRKNPALGGRARFDALERAGARTFHERCAGCHAPRLITDTPSSAVPFEHWERAIFERGGPIVWARDGYEKTGIEPYVHQHGARVPSLRRLYLKRPYFTNGSAASLDEVLARVRLDGRALLHAAGRTDLAGLTPSERAGLRAFLELL